MEHDDSPQHNQIYVALTTEQRDPVAQWLKQHKFGCVVASRHAPFHSSFPSTYGSPGLRCALVSLNCHFFSDLHTVPFLKDSNPHTKFMLLPFLSALTTEQRDPVAQWLEH